MKDYNTNQSTRNKQGTHNQNPNVQIHTTVRDTLALKLNSVRFTALKQGHFTLFHLFPFKTPRRASLLSIASLTLFIKVFELQGKDASAPTGKRFRSYFSFLRLVAMFGTQSSAF
jgi:hypothetical protein